ncbi:type II secretion system protein [Paraburkholderia rhizosphaerae]|uniref:Type II secretion system protein G (GspG) n=1 Tax=Paraburkholderia rhizosphaerae TaxID=480658 RepID=A0A4R8LKG2_9BURK|nr:type II secretion system protein [Paraburkholderia rhizosphaerae]TDY43011.1 type II secretion system protein G (GspG) [Paraburkholderia rhizosphaerae]
MKRCLPERAGFTLIELLIVLAIIALLMTLALPEYFHSIDTSKDKILAQNLHVTRIAIDQFYGDQGRYPDSLQEMVDKHYLRSLPFDPVTDSATTWHIVPPPDEQLPGNVYDLKSGADGTNRDGKPYEEY